MSLKNEAKNQILNVFDNYKIHVMRKNEIKKFEDPRRVEIFSKVKLSNEQEKEIDDLYESNYGTKIPYTWHRHFTAFTGNFDKNYFPELLYIPEFEHYQNMKKAYTDVFSDKNVTPALAKLGGVLVPETKFSCVDGVYSYEGKHKTKREAINVFGSLGESFIKPSIGSSSGNGCAVINMEHGSDTISGKTSVEILDAYGDNFIVQERIKMHTSLSKLYPDSVNTFRIMTYRWHDEFYHVPAILRIGKGGANVDNAHAGGIFIAISDDGILHERAYTEFNSQYDKHPDTKTLFQGYKIIGFHDAINTAIELHKLFPQIGVYNWDFSLNENNEPILIEANMRFGGIWIFQMAHGKGPFGERTPEILQWMREMKKMKYHDRLNHMHGNL